MMRIIVALVTAILAVGWIHGRTVTQLPQQASIVAHFDASTIGIANGASVTSWTDSVGGIVAGTQVGTLPTYATNATNGIAAVSCNGNGGLSIASPGALATTINSQEFTMFIVFKTLGSKSNGALISATAGGVDTFHYIADGTNISKNSNTLPAFAAPYAGQTSWSTFGTTAWSSTPTYSNTGKFQTFYINGGAVQSTAVAAVGLGGQTLTLCDNAGNNFPVNAQIYDIVFWSAPLTPAQYMQAEKWARDRYAQSYPWAGLTALNVFFGDSLTAGVGATTTANTPSYLAKQSLGLSYGQYHSLGVGGITTADMNTLAASWADPLPEFLGIKTNLIGFEWYNQQLVGGCNATCVFNAGQTYVAARHAVANQRVVWGTSTGYSGDPNAGRNSYNSSFDGTIPNANIDSYIALHNNAQIGTSTAYADHPANWSDGVHLSNTGYPFLAAEFVSGIGALP